MSFGRRLRAWITLAAFLGTFAAPVATLGHFTPDDDAACGQVVFAGHTSTQFESPVAGPPLGHCALCHWLRAVGGAAPVVPRAVVALAGPDIAAPPVAERSSASAAPIERPSRAPPTL